MEEMDRVWVAFIKDSYMFDSHVGTSEKEADRWAARYAVDGDEVVVGYVVPVRIATSQKAVWKELKTDG